uniref:Docking protein 1 n=1 Tax=Chelonoidis abingdonii TaxID=106734 RepID=A0A8C0J4U6_CHEAB
MMPLQRWKKNWFVLYPASQHGVARLEFFDCKDPGAPAEKLSTKRLDKKIIRLADCVSVASVPESGPKDSTAVFRLETSDRSYLFAAEKEQSVEWVKKLCEIAFSVSTASKESDTGALALEMAVNSIYYSREEVNAFWVTVQRTEAAERCALHGSYMLKAEQDSLILKEPRTQETLYTWPYRLLRRYGRDKVMFSFEAGRRCESGPGNFTFETKQGNEIFRLVEASIREQKAQVEENRQSCDSLDLDCPSVVLIRNALADSLSLELPAEGDESVCVACLRRCCVTCLFLGREEMPCQAPRGAVPLGEGKRPDFRWDIVSGTYMLIRMCQSMKSYHRIIDFKVRKDHYDHLV